MTTATAEATTPEDVRAGLLVLSQAAAVDLSADVTPALPVGQLRAALFDVTPALIDTYATASSALGADWYEDAREVAGVVGRFSPVLATPTMPDEVRAMIAATTPELRDTSTRKQIEDPEAYVAQVVEDVVAEMEREIADALRETVLESAEKDPAAVGWRRYARPNACRFCKMLADRGAVYSERSVRFAAHSAMTNGERTGGNCMCVVGPGFDPDAPRASVMQKTASKRTRSPEERAALRDYLTTNYPDASG